MDSFYESEISCFSSFPSLEGLGPSFIAHNIGSHPDMPSSDPLQVNQSSSLHGLNHLIFCLLTTVPLQTLLLLLATVCAELLPADLEIKQHRHRTKLLTISESD